MPEPVQSIPVFVSYTHDSPAHSKRVLNLSNALRQAGFDCDIDQYHVNQDWPAWMETFASTFLLCGRKPAVSATRQ